MKLNHNCEKCAKGYYPFLDDPYEKNCYDDIMKSRGYRLVRGYWQTCYESCDTCFSAPTFDSSGKILLFHNCLSCYEGYNFIYNTKDCVNDTYLNYGYYLDDNDLFYKKCDISCKTCNKYSNAENPRCKTCNNDEGYYFAENQPNDICYNQYIKEQEKRNKERKKNTSNDTIFTNGAINDIFNQTDSYYKNNLKNLIDITFTNDDTVKDINNLIKKIEKNEEEKKTSYINLIINILLLMN